MFFTHPKDSFKMSVIDEEKRKQALNSTFINSEALSHFNLLKKEQMFLVQQLPHLSHFNLLKKEQMFLVQQLPH